MANELDFDTNTDIGQYVKDWEADHWLSEGMLDPDVMSSILMNKYSDRNGLSEKELIELWLTGVPEGMRRKQTNYLNDITHSQRYDPKRNMFYSDYRSPQSGQISDQWRPHHAVDPQGLITDQDQIDERYKTWWEPWGNAGYDMGQAVEAGYGNVDAREHLTYEPWVATETDGNLEVRGGWQMNPQDVITDPPVQNYTAPDRGDWGPGLHLARGGIVSLMQNVG